MSRDIAVPVGLRGEFKQTRRAPLRVEVDVRCSSKLSRVGKNRLSTPQRTCTPTASCMWT